MNDFIQMDIFFFISSVLMIILIILAMIIGTYAILFVKKVNSILKNIDDVVKFASSQGKESIQILREHLEKALNSSSVLTKTITTVVLALLSKTIKKYAKIKKEAPKKRK